MIERGSGKSEIEKRKAEVGKRKAEGEKRKRNQERGTRVFFSLLATLNFEQVLDREPI